VGGQPAQQGRIELACDLRQLVGRRARRSHITCGSHDLDGRGKQSQPGHAVLRLVDDAMDRRVSGLDLSQRQPQLRQTRLWLSSPQTGLALRLLGLREFPPQPV
jgi:hypothetical protein